MYEGYLWAGIIILLTVAVLEIWNPRLLNEGFSNLVSVGESAMWSRWMPRRGDIGSNADKEEGGYIRELRYFSGYTDVQRLGKEHDFCRMVVPISNDPKEMFFACALGGTDGLSTVKFRTQNVRDGLQISRDE
jgi:hypothetical protein